MKKENKQPSFYAIIPANVRYDEELKANAKLLYGEITALCNQEGFCWASNGHFANLYKVSKTSISKWISQLQDRGYITVALIYKEGTKEIEKRVLKISLRPIEEKFNTPIEEKFKDNTKLINTKSNISIDWDKLILAFNIKTGKKIKSVNEKARRQIKIILKDYTKTDLMLAIQNCYDDSYHIETKHKHLTLEFISRGDKFERFYSMEPKVAKVDLGNRADEITKKEESQWR